MLQSNGKCLTSYDLKAAATGHSMAREWLFHTIVNNDKVDLPNP
jgi:hypothetical protein